MRVQRDLLTITIADLNKILGEFYAAYAKTQTAEEWLDVHDFEAAVADDAVLKWSAQ